MPSPFPGMDPFIESQEWEDFHTTFNTVIREWLSPRVEPDYLVRVERRVYVEHPADDTVTSRIADVAVVKAADHDSDEAGLQPEAATATAVAPVECELPMPQERRETYLVIREQATRAVITVIETLSPANKRLGGDGRREYLRKREEVLQSRSHLVELDLLRGGERMPTVDPLPPADYYAIVSRAERRPRAQVYAWTLRQPLPDLPIPLKKGDPDVIVPLQSIFTTVYDRARYHLSLDYTQPLDPPLAAADAEWLAELLRKAATDSRKEKE